MTPLPSVTELQMLYRYDPATGILYRRTWSNKGNVVGAKRYHNGRPVSIVVRVDMIRRNVASIIWKMMTGNDPVSTIDHINNNPFDNRWVNLREAIPIQQAHNRTNTNSLNYKGINRHGNGYRARILVNGKRKYLGYFDTIQEAHQAYCDAAKLYFKQFANYG